MLEIETPCLGKKGILESSQRWETIAIPLPISDIQVIILVLLWIKDFISMYICPIFLFFSRFQSTHCLNRILMELDSFEQEFHFKDPKKVLQCRRLHLGSSDTFRVVMNSIRSGLNQVKLNDCSEKDMKESNFFKVLSYGILPFSDVAAMYLEMTKNITLAYFIYTTLCDMTGDKIWDPDYRLETTLTITIIFAICLAQVSKTILCIIWNIILESVYFRFHFFWYPWRLDLKYLNYVMMWRKIIHGEIASTKYSVLYLVL